MGKRSVWRKDNQFTAQVREGCHEPVRGEQPRNGAGISPAAVGVVRLCEKRPSSGGQSEQLPGK